LALRRFPVVRIVLAQVSGGRISVGLIMVELH